MFSLLFISTEGTDSLPQSPPYCTAMFLQKQTLALVRAFRVFSRHRKGGWDEVCSVGCHLLTANKSYTLDLWNSSTLKDVVQIKRLYVQLQVPVQRVDLHSCRWAVFQSQDGYEPGFVLLSTPSRNWCLCSNCGRKESLVIRQRTDMSFAIC